MHGSGPDFGAIMEIIILPAEGCRRSRRVLQYLDDNGVTYRRVDLETTEGQALLNRHQFRASPGILVDGVPINPFDILEAPACRMKEPQAARAFEIAGVSGTNAPGNNKESSMQ
jgi:glutaredoxin